MIAANDPPEPEAMFMPYFGIATVFTEGSFALISR